MGLRNRPYFGNVLRLSATLASPAHDRFRCAVSAGAGIRLVVFRLCHLPGGPADRVLPGDSFGNRGVGIDSGKAAPPGFCRCVAGNFQNLPWFGKNISKIF